MPDGGGVLARGGARSGSGDRVPAVWQTFQSLQLFDLVYVTTRGGPLQSTTVVVLYVWQQAFQFFNAGYGAAAAYVLAFGLLVAALGVGFYQRRREARLA